MNIGFTGTQDGMTPAQQAALFDYLTVLGAATLHHGDCIGADVEAAVLATSLGLRTHGHPPDNPKKRAFFDSDVSEPEAPYLVRNRAIVAACELLIACPSGFAPRRRSGTWTTARYAHDAHKPVVTIFPDGTMTIDSLTDLLTPPSSDQLMKGAADADDS